MLRFALPGVTEAEFDPDPRAALKRVYFSLPGLVPLNSLLPEVARDAEFLASMPDVPDGPLPFVSDAELDAMAATFARTGFTGAFNRYRAAAFDAQTSADTLGATVNVPSCFIGGSRDPVRAMIPGVDGYLDPGAGCTDLRGATIVDGPGHWIQQEAPSETNAALDAFLATL